MLADSSGQVVDKTYYLPFGEYRCGLIYMNAKFYSPSSGRFITADTIIPNPQNPQSFNRYSYVQNNPLRFVDPTGHQDECGWLEFGCQVNNFIEETKENYLDSLRNQATDCYASGDAGCIRNVYLQLALGGYLQDMPTASHMMLNHLTSGDDVEITSEEIVADRNAKAAIDKIHLSALDEAVNLAIAQGAGIYDLVNYSESVSASSDNLWYAMGRFTIQSTNNVAIITANNDGTYGITITLNFSIEDVYDWHPEQGLQAGGSQQGVAGFNDAWGQLLVDEGLASEFTMRASWSETISYHLTVISVNGE